MSKYEQKQTDKYVKLYYNGLSNIKIGVETSGSFQYYVFEVTFLKLSKTYKFETPFFQKPASFCKNKVINMLNCAIIMCIR